MKQYFNHTDRRQSSGLINIYLNSIIWIGLLLFSIQGSIAQINVLGTATPANDWLTDYAMTQNPSDPNEFSIDLFLSVNAIKFRIGNTWMISWGGNDFPSGSTIPGGPNIEVDKAGIYQIIIHLGTQTYNFNYIGVGNVGIGTNMPDSSAILDLSSTSYGLLLPRMTKVQREAIDSPAKGLIIFNIESDCINYFTGTSWLQLCGDCEDLSAPAFAGSSKTISADSIQLEANPLSEYEHGTWSVVSGPGGTFGDAMDPTSYYSPSATGAHVLEWVISNDCQSDTAVVQLTFFEGIFVNDDFGGTPDGTRNAPYPTIAAAIAAAINENKDTSIIIAGGTYTESLVLDNITFSINFLGGFDETNWQQNITNHLSQINGSVSAITISNCDDIHFSGLDILSSDAINFGESSYGIKVLNSTVTLDSVSIKAGKGMNGNAGAVGLIGVDGGPGSDGDVGCEHSTSPCSTCIPGPQGGEGGSGNNNGGMGGNPGLGFGVGQNGEDGQGNSFSGGLGVEDGAGFSPPIFSAHGEDGSMGNNGSAGSGGINIGNVNSSGYVNSNTGGNGTTGSPGTGGGGGGGGGGGSDFCDSYGSGGGGGGAGGDGGASGTGGEGGGGSFAIFAYTSTLSITNSTIRTSNGGRGGNGGIRGLGGMGGEGGFSQYGTSASQDDGSLGGDGGMGGQGGHGGSGGGGGGGPSLGISSQSSSVNQFNNSFLLGNAGQGGSGSNGAGNGNISIRANTYNF